jgi:hypothetical protein
MLTFQVISPAASERTRSPVTICARIPARCQHRNDAWTACREP